MGRFGAALGAGAAKVGKKAAQSEAGRSAGRAAVAGATEGVKQDLTNRYFGPGEATRSPSPSPQPKPPPAAVSTPSSQTHTTHQDTTATTSHTHQSHRASTEPRPPKPSLLSRFKPHIGKSSDKPVQRRRPRRQSSQHDRVYKYNLSKEANWDDKLRVQALYNYKAERPCDLEFRKGQILQVLTRTENQNDWWEGNLDGRVGIFPANYVKIL